MLTEEEKVVASKWLRIVNVTAQELELGAEAKPLTDALTLREDGMAVWETDARLEELLKMETALKQSSN